MGFCEKERSQRFYYSTDLAKPTQALKHTKIPKTTSHRTVGRAAYVTRSDIQRHEKMHAEQISTKTLDSNAYVSHTTTTHAADVMRSTNSFSPIKLKPAMLTSSTLSIHAMLTSSNLTTDSPKDLSTAGSYSTCWQTSQQ
ncbi:hypothetical protein F511_34312 [Dorcoceras hygrometricum]|uniref:Uncharacterized protein n=1 Tax=Dorcoceras hygrometricum TaxID=472368 RepID=A0A2Z7ATM1_9LAMI|nr:hypothetical protein F511_34312 [Dorcoceras hygrometricum]